MFLLINWQGTNDILIGTHLFSIFRIFIELHLWGSYHKLAVLCELIFKGHASTSKGGHNLHSVGTASTFGTKNQHDSRFLGYS